jgi:hypothetical protein
MQEILGDVKVYQIKLNNFLANATITRIVGMQRVSYTVWYSCQCCRKYSTCRCRVYHMNLYGICASAVRNKKIQGCIQNLPNSLLGLRTASSTAFCP